MVMQCAKEMMEPSDLNIIDYLNHKGIKYDEHGKNISQDWIGIRCPWCDDDSNHLGIHTTRGTINCFRCPIKGTVIRLIMKIERCGYDAALKVISDFNRFRSEHTLPLPEARTFKFRDLGESDYDFNLLSQFNFVDDILPVHENFLNDRYFDPIHLVDKYKIKFCGPLGDYKLRIIVPIFDRGKCISFVTRDATNQASTPYINCPNELSLADLKDQVYNIDNANNPDVIVVEGVTDVWRMGDDVVATFGIKYTPMQILTLTRYRRCFVLFDAEPLAQEQAHKLCADLSTVIHEVVRLELPEGDPAELSESDVKSLRKQVFGKIY
jgi:DNA primase